MKNEALALSALCPSCDDALMSGTLELAQSIFEEVDCSIKALTDEELVTYQFQITSFHDKIQDYIGLVDKQKDNVKSQILGLKGKRNKVNEYNKVKGFLP